MIGQSAFARCKLENIEISDKNNSYAIAKNIGGRHDSKYFGSMIVKTSDVGDSYNQNFKGNNCAGCLVTGYIYFGNNITQIETGALKRCYGISRIYLDQNISSIGDNVFMDCINLNEIIWSELTAKPTKLKSNVFANIVQIWKLDLINSDESKLSERDLINYSKKNCGLPNGWEDMDKVIPYDNTSLNSTTSFFGFQSVSISEVDGYSVCISNCLSRLTSMVDQFCLLLKEVLFNLMLVVVTLELRCQQRLDILNLQPILKFAKSGAILFKTATHTN